MFIKFVRLFSFNKLNCNPYLKFDYMYHIVTILLKARALHKDRFPKVVSEFFLPAIAVERYLERLRQSHFHVTDPKLQRRDQLLALNYFFGRFRGRF